MATEEVVSTCRKEKQNNSVVDKKTGLNHIVLGLFWQVTGRKIQLTQQPEENLLSSCCFISCLIKLTSLVAQTVKRLPTVWETWVQFLGQEALLREGNGNPLHYSLDFPGGSDGKVSVYNVRDPGSSPGLGRSLGEGNGNPLRYYCLENPKDRGAW